MGAWRCHTVDASTFNPGDEAAATVNSPQNWRSPAPAIASPCLPQRLRQAGTILCDEGGPAPPAGGSQGASPRHLANTFVGRASLGKSIDATIGQIEAAERLDRPGYLLGKAISRTGQVVGKPGTSLADTLHVQPYGIRSTRSSWPSRSGPGRWRWASTSWPPLGCCATAAPRARPTWRCRQGPPAPPRPLPPGSPIGST